eukprot:TRINITY_DN11929_c0_g1_i1.p1 TRINITY_DN11929_c0_g1~~TRINITY_DN11929_c0_g1_i1.p1  ORF type:complete len:468 (-),score=85.07 TRINITY_DN11929_c0_g1_i1:206-1558(-)
MSLFASDAWGFGGPGLMHRRKGAGQSRATPTPVRALADACGTCRECGWRTALGLCACGFKDMDPLRPIRAVLALTPLAPDDRAAPGSAFAELELDCWPLLDEGEALEIRLALPSQPGRLALPHAMEVFFDDDELARLEPPGEGGKRSDAPIELRQASARPCVGRQSGHVLRVMARPAPLAERISIGHAAATEFVLCLARVGIRSVEELARECCLRPPIRIRSSFELLDELRASEDSQAVKCESPWLQPLSCPLSCLRLRVPVRGLHCRHLQAFELEAFLVTNAAISFQRRWRCPVCDAALKPEQLAVCKLTTHLLRNLNRASLSAPLDALRKNFGAGGSREEGGGGGGPARPSAARPRWRRGVLHPEDEEDTYTSSFVQQLGPAAHPESKSLESTGQEADAGRHDSLESLPRSVSQQVAGESAAPEPLGWGRRLRRKIATDLLHVWDICE